jgi:hypothetical protein
MAETYTGHVRNGVVVFEGEIPPEGTAVRVEPAKLDAALVELADILLEFAGKATGLPSDMAAQHDHYLHGQPKR